MTAHNTVSTDEESGASPSGWHSSAGEGVGEWSGGREGVKIRLFQRREGGDSCRGSRESRCKSGKNDTGMLVLKEGSTECNRIIRPRVCASTEASADTVDTNASCNLALDDSTRGKCFGFDLFVVGKLEFDTGFRRGRRVKGDSSNLGDGEGRAGEGDWRSRTVQG